MAATITGVPAVSGPDNPTAGQMTERMLQDFVAGVQSGVTSGMPRLANPAALASEFFGSLRGYLERTQNIQRAIWRQSPGAEGGANVVLALPSDGQHTNLHAGPAGERLEPADADSGDFPAVRTTPGHLDRAMELALAAMTSAIETTVLTHGTSQVVRSVNSLLRGQ